VRIRLFQTPAAQATIEISRDDFLAIFSPAN
jgi:hypothetical protein